MSYLRTWFVVDGTMVLSDWRSFVVGSSFTFRMFSWAKMRHMLRIFGVMQMLRFVRVRETFADRTASETGSLVIRIGTIVVAILWLAHLLCGF
jgi:hypothetical protein